VSAPARPRPGIPWYAHPAEHPAAWERLAADLAGADGIDDGFVVVNVHDGPGDEDDPYYGPALARLRAAAPGLLLLGYVDLDYGRRDLAAVLLDASHWRRRYGIRAVMLDRFPSGREPAGATAAALRAVAALRAEGAGPVAGNPGVVPVPELARALDVTCEFEGTGRDYLREERALPATRGSWHLVHSCTAEELRAVTAAAARRGVDHVFVTDGAMPHPWGGYAGSGARDAVEQVQR
jgi:hypothetical protein